MCVCIIRVLAVLVKIVYIDEPYTILYYIKQTKRATLPPRSAFCPLPLNERRYIRIFARSFVAKPEIKVTDDAVVQLYRRRFMER